MSRSISFGRSRSKRFGLLLVALLVLYALAVASFAGPAQAQSGVVLYRINSGGPLVAAIDSGPDWEADSTNSYFNTGNTASHSVSTFDPSVPASTPTDIFQTERWDPPATPELLYSFPTGAGSYEVRLYFADGYTGTSAPGERVFDVSIEGALVLDDYDAIVDVGDQTGVMKSFLVTSDATLDIEFGHVTENPQINGIEILTADAEGYLSVSPSSHDFGLTEIGVPSVQTFTLENLGATDDIVIDPITLSGDFSASTSQVTLAAGDTTTFDVTFTPSSVGVVQDTVTLTHDGSNSPIDINLQGEGYDPAAAPIAFDSGPLNNVSLNNPTSLEFGPDGRLYVSQQNGTIYALTVQRNSSTDYQVTASETINLIKNNVPNHNDDGTTNTNDQRQVTGLMTGGTASNPVLYVTSSDWRIAVSNDTGLDTNSGVITRLTWNGSTWDEVDIVRGLPRSEENHSVNGLDLDPVNNVLYVMVGGHTNKGAPGNNFSGTPEYAYSAAMLSVDLDMIESMPIYTDLRTNRSFIYDLPTLDDPTRANIDNTDPDFPYPAGHPYHGNQIDPGDPFGGNNGQNQAIFDLSGPVQVFSPGYRNAYDVVFTEDGRIYTYDNGPNGGWGGLPVNEGPAGNCTNEFNESGSTGYGDGLHFVTQGYYGGHPNPTRGNPTGSGLYVYEEDGSGWVAAATYDWTTDFPVPPVPAGSANPVECDYLIPQSEDGTLAIVNASTNGIAEYTASNFGGAMQGDVLAASFNGNIYRYQFNAVGDAVTDSEALFGGIGSQPLDVTTQGDSDPFPGTVWAAVYGPDDIVVFEPVDFGSCSGDDDPALDEDNDGYDNADEIDNGTNPCSGGSVPNDNDGDFTSDLNDDDDDEDGILDVVDVFAIDPDNGTATDLPLNYTLFNNDPGTGFFGLGFTGLMNNGSDYLTLYDENNLAAGGASGKFTVEAVPVGDAFQDDNTQEYGFQFGINVDTNTEPFLVRTRLDPPYFAVNGSPTPPEDFQSYGMFIGTGDQDNYLKLVLRGNNGTNGVQVLNEVNSIASQSNYNITDILNAPSIDLYLSVDPAAGTVQPYVQLGAGAITPLGSPLAIPASWLDPNDSQGLAVGTIATSTNSSVEFGATWDYFQVNYVAPGELGATPSSVDFGQVPEGDISAIEVVNLENLGVATDPTIDVTGVVVTGTDAADFGVSFTGPVTLDPGASTPVDVTCSPATTGAKSAALEVTHNGTNSPLLVPLTCEGVAATTVLYRVNAGGPQLAAADGSSPDWSEDQANPDGAANGTASTGSSSPYNNVPSSGDTTFGTASTITISSTVPASVPEALFQLERFDTDPPVDELLWDFPVSAGGTYEVRVYLAEVWDGATTPGVRVFDIAVEGTVPAEFDDIDVFAIGGYQNGFMLSTQVTVADNNLDIDFLRSVQNPAVKGLEIVQIGAVEPVETVGVDPASLDFATVIVGESSAPQVVTLTHLGSSGAADIDVTSVSITGTYAADFTHDFTPTVTLSAGMTDTIDVTFTPAAGGSRTAQMLVEHTGDNSPLTVDLTGEGTEPVTDGVLYRINVGGPQTAAADGSSPDWDVDNATSPSIYRVSGSNNLFDITSGQAYSPIDMTDPSLPPSAPVTIFETERWDQPSDPEMVWQFPVSGTVEVRLYFAELFNGITAAGERVFDVAVEGSVPAPFDDVDPYGVAGAAGAFMRSTTVNVTDGTLDLEFIHGIENPALKGIEILGATATTNPSALIQVNPGSGVSASTYNGGAFSIANTGDVDITSVSFDLSSSYLPDVVFDPAGTAGDAGAKCLTPDSGATATGFITPGDPCVDPFSAPHNGVDSDDGFDVMTMSFGDFGNGESFTFSTDIDPTSIKNDTTSGDAGAISGFELIGSLVTVEFADGSVITSTLYDEGSLGGSAALVAPDAPAAPSISLLDVPSLPAVLPDPAQTVVISGTPGADVSLLQVDARLYIDAGGGGYDLDPFEANEALAKSLYTGVIPVSGTLEIPVTLLLTASPDAGPDAGLNHFIAVVEGTGEQNSLTSNSFVVEYDPTAVPDLVITPDPISITLTAGQSGPVSYTVDTSDGSTMPTPAAMSTSEPWASTTSAANQGVPYDVFFDATGLSAGTYTATLTAGPVTGYNDGTATLILNVVADAPPALTLLGDNPLTLEVGTPFSDPGATANDAEDGDLTGSIITDTTALDVNVLGSYPVTYTVTDSGSNTVTETRTVDVVDTTPPVIALQGSDPYTITVGTVYVDPGATATDNYDASVPVVVDDSAVMTDTVGSYVVTYNAMDSSGNPAVEVTRTVAIEEAPPATVVLAGDYQFVPGDVITVPIAVENIPSAGLGTSSVTVTYDAALLAVDSCEVDPDGDFNFGACNENAGPGVVAFNATSVTGVTTDTILAEIAFAALGNVGDVSPLDITINTFADPSGTDIPVTDDDGSVQLGITGDVNCDGMADIVDSQFIAEYDVGLRTSTAQCPLADFSTNLTSATCDVNGDNACNTIDALFIGQCTVGLSNAFCPAPTAPSSTEAATSSTIPEGPRAPEQNPMVSVGNGEIDGDNLSVTVPVTVTVPSDGSVGALTVDIFYDTQLINAIDCSTVDAIACGVNSVYSDAVSIGFFEIGGLSGGEAVLANLTFEGLGPAGVSQLTPVVRTYNGTGEAQVQSGQIEVVEPLPTAISLGSVHTAVPAALPPVVASFGLLLLAGTALVVRRRRERIA